MIVEMKDSGIAWIGEIPKHWNISKVSNHYNVQLGKMLQPKKELADDKLENYLCAANVSKNQLHLDSIKQMWMKQCERDLYSLKKGDLLVVEGGDVASCDILKEDISNLYFQNALHRVRPIGKNDNRYLRYILLVAKDSGHIDLICNKATISHFTKDKFEKLVFLNVPKEEQSCIANFLDKKCAEIDELIALQEQMIAHLNTYKQAVITETVTKGLDPNVKMKDSGVEWIGDIPEHWDVVPVKYLGRTQNGISKGGDYFGEGYPFVNYGDIYKNYFIGSNDASGLAKSTKEDQTNYSVVKGDVFFTRTSETIEEIGFSCACIETINNATFSGFLIRFRPYANILHPIYSGFYFRSTMHRQYFVKEMNIVTRTSLGQELLKGLPVLLPPLVEQQSIANYLDKKCKEIDELISIKKDKIEQLKAYKKSVIFEYVTGKKQVI